MLHAYEMNRKNMVERQLLPNGIDNPALLAVLLAMPREKFVPPLMQSVAYCDAPIAVGHGSYVPEPMGFARMVQAAKVRGSDIVLDIGCSTGYSSAVLAGLANMVVGIDSHKSAVQLADKLLRDLDIANAAIIYQEVLDHGYIQQAPYDVIFINGAIPAVPAELKNQLNIGGRLIAVVSGKRGSGTAVLMTRSESGFKTKMLFELGLPALQNFSVREGFKF